MALAGVLAVSELVAELSERTTFDNPVQKAINDIWLALDQTRLHLAAIREGRADPNKSQEELAYLWREASRSAMRANLPDAGLMSLKSEYWIDPLTYNDPGLDISIEKVTALARSLLARATPSAPPTTPPVHSDSDVDKDVARPAVETKKRFRVGLSFAGEKRDYVAAMAEHLAARFGRNTILYDRYHRAELARGDLAFYLPDLYHKHVELIVVVVCRDYEKKEWCGLEWNAIYDLQKQRKYEEVMLLRFDRASARGLYSTAGFVDLDDITPEQGVSLVVERLALNEGQSTDSHTSAPSPYDETDEKLRQSEGKNRDKPRTSSQAIDHMASLTYANLDNKYSKILDVYDERPRFFKLENTESYKSTFSGDELEKYHAFARRVFDFLETVYDTKEDIDIGDKWHVIFYSQLKLHNAWYKDNKAHVALNLVSFVDSREEI